MLNNLNNEIYNLTPVEKHGDIYFKRDDLFQPFGKVNGGKFRQCLSLVYENLDNIKNNYDSTIATYASVVSPQNPILADIANHLKLKSLIGIGNTTLEKAKKHKGIQYALDMNSEIVILCKNQAFNNVLSKRMDMLLDKRRFFKINFGFHIKQSKKSIIDTIGYQVKNIPNEIEQVVVPMGSCITFCGIVEGKRKYKKNFNIIGIQPFGYNRKKFIYESLDGMVWDYNFTYYTGNYSYGKLLKYKIDETLDLDMIYESKAFDYMIKNKIHKGKKTCFWIVGNSNWMR